MEPRSYSGDRLWSQRFLGYIKNDNRVIYYCSKLAQRKGYDHFVKSVDKCFSSYAMPGNVWKVPDDFKDYSPTNHREFVKPFFIRAMRKFQSYRIKWSKFDSDRLKWIKIFDYFVTDPNRQTSLLYTMKSEQDNDIFADGRRFRARERFRSYDKAYYGDDFTGSHVLEIERWSPVDTGTYKIEVLVPSRGVGNQAVIELRHEDVPEITWVTPSPHVAVKDISDILEVKIDNEKTLITVEWYHNGTQIERKTEGFTFP
ncbi:uncharacterized protein LOC111346915, partial [Stylophora pistillata]|uniref:uncharacterized protein LOC111346915 n=1 Tax=Stylophora pistillata TaxID=50429 RepID=UPI000C03C5DA